LQQRVSEINRIYPNGKYTTIAKEWNNMSTKELLYRLEAQKLPGLKDKEEDDEEDVKDNTKKDSEAIR